MNILAFCFFPAFVPVSNGGQSRLYNFYHALSKHHSITLLTSTHLGVEEETVRHGANFIERRIPKDDFFAEKYSALEKISSGGDLSGPALASCGKSPTLLHKAFIEEYSQCDIVIHDSPFTIDFDIFAGIDNKPRVYNSYNCETELYKQLHPSSKSMSIHKLVDDAEKRLLRLSSLVLYCNEADLHSFKSMVNDSAFDAVFAPNGMSPILIEPKRDVENKKIHAVFMGSGHPPNAQAANFILDRVAPHCPDIIFDFIGSCLPEGKYAANVIRHGVVTDALKREILSRADFALNPMGEGSGSNVKVLDYYSYGIPVVSTEFGMRGIEATAGKDYIAASLDNFLDSLRQAKQSFHQAETIGKSGKQLAERHYTWQAIVDAVNTKLASLFAELKCKNSKKFILALNDYDSFSGVGGGCTRTQGLYENAKQWCDVVFLCFSNDGTLGTRKHCDGITVINIPKASDHKSDNDYINSQFHVSADDIISGRHAHQNTWLVSIYEQLRRSARCIVIEHCYMVKVPVLFGDRFVHSSHNNETILKKRLLEFHPSAKELLEEVEYLERLAVENSALTVAVSQEDAESLVVGKRTSGPVMVVPNGASHAVTGFAVESLKSKIKNKIGDRAVVFLGSAHMPNIEAANYIISNLATECPDVRFHIIGSVCSAITKAPQNVTLWGVVDELTKSAVMQSCALALNPMKSGSGSNVKQADYLGNGLYVISTVFGHRGYPKSTNKHVSIIPLDGFGTAIRQTLGDREKLSEDSKRERFALFDRELSMHGLADRFTAFLKGLEKKRKRVLYVAYRYTAPAMGGAEINMEQFIAALGNSDEFFVDVIAPEISSIHNDMRFGERYSFGGNISAPVNIPNVRFARFIAEDLPENIRKNKLRDAWSAQVSFEKELNLLFSQNYRESGLTYGWGSPEADCARWAFCDFGIFLHENKPVSLSGHAKECVVLTASNQGVIIFGPEEVSGHFSIVLPSITGEINFTTSHRSYGDDPRPLSLYISKIDLDDNTMDISSPTLIGQCIQKLPGADSFYVLDSAAERSRAALDIRLTDSRGPWSSELERFIKNHIQEYDLVVAHNNVFKPAVVAMAEAKKNAVPAILIPHPHLDDDFYHFPDLLESARNATQVLAVPKAACTFYESKGCNVTYMPAGCNTDEEYTEEDKQAYQELYNSERPFVLVLGRKAGAKGYQYIIDAVEQLNKQGTDIQAVLIGPDDDGILINSQNALYLGRQPRNIVRGALLSCVALVNMSSSESFGIVLLEAWLAGKPVIANKNCVAFHDMAINNVNSILVGIDELVEGIDSIAKSPALAAKLAKEGYGRVSEFDWSRVAGNFLNTCFKITR